ncbi:MAG TPA: hypothetical protein H9780_01995 [Candidatus Mediterraneibacter merdavium]|nr:hypothetical protein [Candidatus Mediterraneibacter merdavium]
MRTQARKLAAAGLTAAMTVTMLAACGTKATPENLLRDMSKRAEETESITANIKMELDVAASGESVRMGVDFDMETITEPEMSSAKGSVSLGSGDMDITMEMETYSEKKDDEYVIYTMMDDMWSVETADSAEMTADMGIVSEDFQKFSDRFELKDELVEVNGKDCFELTGELDGELLAQMMDEDMMSSFTGFGADESDLADMILPCTIDIYKDSILPARIYFDMGDSLFPLLEGLGMEKAECSVEMTFLEYDSVKEIVIPQEALEAEETSGDDWWYSDDDNDTDSAAVPIEPASQSADLGSTWSDYTVQINDTVITLPCTLEDIEKTGLTLDTDYTERDYLVDAGDYELAWFVDGNGNEIIVHMVNDSDGQKELQDCLAGGINVDSYSVEQGGITVLFPGGVQIGSDPQEAVNAYGEPDDLYEDAEYGNSYYWQEGSGLSGWCEIDTDPESGLVDSLYLICYE